MPIEARNIAGVAEVLEACGGIPRSTLIRWREKNGFPEPVKRLKSGEVWDLAEVRVWLKRRQRASGRRPLERRHMMAVIAHKSIKECPVCGRTDGIWPCSGGRDEGTWHKPMHPVEVEYVRASTHQGAVTMVVELADWLEGCYGTFDPSEQHDAMDTLRRARAITGQ